MTDDNKPDQPAATPASGASEPATPAPQRIIPSPRRVRGGVPVPPEIGRQLDERIQRGPRSQKEEK